MVLISRMIVPGFAEEKTPALSQYTEWTAASLARLERITSESATRSTIDAAIGMPARLSSSAGLGLRFHA
jgi:hypothetical protein